MPSTDPVLHVHQGVTPINAYDVIQVYSGNGRWSDYFTIREPHEASDAAVLVIQGTFGANVAGPYRIVRSGEVVLGGLRSSDGIA